jgi:hypothetical protein
MNTFEITYNLDQLYPDIQGELYSKHTIALNQLHKDFNKTYSSTFLNTQLIYPPITSS